MGVKRQTLTIAVIFAVILWTAAAYTVVFGIPETKTSKASAITITNGIEKPAVKKPNRLTPDGLGYDWEEKEILSPSWKGYFEKGDVNK